VRVGNRRLLQILVDAAAAADEFGLQLDRHLGAVILRNPVVDAMLF
jgi:hypothetical protein